MKKQLTSPESISLDCLWVAWERSNRFIAIRSYMLQLCRSVVVAIRTCYDKRVGKTAFWIFHGTDDSVVDVKLSREMQTKLKSLKVENKYSEYPGVNHNSWDNAFADPAFLSWAFKHKRK